MFILPNNTSAASIQRVYPSRPSIMNGSTRRMDAADRRSGWTRRMDATDGRDGWTRRTDAADIIFGNINN